MKAISIKQPWANLIASGEKTIETRVWSTSYRGEVLLVSSKIPKIEPAGFAVATAELVECRPMTLEDEAAACCAIYPDAISWVFKNVRAIEPFEVKGQLGLYDIEVSPEKLLPRKKPKQRTFFD
ncbi:MAG TPA: ASCH domain-containing protein [Verrucomicrobiae bacterium]